MKHILSHACEQHGTDSDVKVTREMTVLTRSCGTVNTKSGHTMYYKHIPSISSCDFLQLTPPNSHAYDTIYPSTIATNTQHHDICVRHSFSGSLLVTKWCISVKLLWNMPINMQYNRHILHQKVVKTNCL